MNIIGNNLMRMRQFLGLTRAQVAAILKIDAFDVIRYEEGRKIPDSQMIINFAKLYGVKCADILTPHKVYKNKDEKAIADLKMFLKMIKSNK